MSWHASQALDVTPASLLMLNKDSMSSLFTSWNMTNALYGPGSSDSMLCLQDKPSAVAVSSQLLATASSAVKATGKGNLGGPHAASHELGGGAPYGPGSWHRLLARNKRYRCTMLKSSSIYTCVHALTCCLEALPKGSAHGVIMYCLLLSGDEYHTIGRRLPVRTHCLAC